MKYTLVSLTVLLLILAGCGKREDARNKLVEKRMAMVSQLAAKCHATADWWKPLKARDVLGFPLHSVDFYRALVRPDSQPVVFLAQLEDVWYDKDTLKVMFKAWVSSDTSLANLSKSVGFMLSISPEFLRSIEDFRNDKYAEYAVVARVLYVESLESLFFYQPSSFSYDYLAWGKCLDIVSTPRH